MDRHGNVIVIRHDNGLETVYENNAQNLVQSGQTVKAGQTIAIIGNDGSFDSCITIRSAFVKDGKAYVQAGCGVVYDSDPKSECQETVNKARSTLTAIYMALDTLNKR